MGGQITAALATLDIEDARLATRNFDNRAFFYKLIHRP
jgi:hypothetical protein